MKRSTSKILIAIGSASAAFACGSAEVTLKLMDAPPPGVTSVRLHVASMDVHVAGDDSEQDADLEDDGRWESLDVDRQVDLMEHQGESAALTLGVPALPEGKVTQIRVKLDSTEENVVTYNDADCDLDMSRVSPVGTKINHPFKAFASDGDGDQEIIVDFDLGQSLKASGDCFMLKPVIKLHRVRSGAKTVNTGMN